MLAQLTLLVILLSFKIADDDKDVVVKFRDVDDSNAVSRPIK